MAARRITLELVDGRQFEFEGHYALPADRVELERKFGMAMGDRSAPGKEEWVIYLLWRCAVRSLPEMKQAPFEGFLAQLESYTFPDDSDEEGASPLRAVNPTDLEAPTG